MNDDLVVIAKLLRTRGLRGELVAEILTDFPERFDGLKNVVGIFPNGKRENLEIEKFWFQKDRIILKFKGFETIEKAEALRNVEICVPETEAVELGDDEFFDWEIEGCEVETIEGEKIGQVREIMRTKGSENLVVTSAVDEKKDFLIPFVSAICVEVDIENKLIKADLPDGLLEF